MKLIIMRGWPGSGKSHLARLLGQTDSVICSADDFFMRDGIYCYDGSKIRQAHQACQNAAKTAMESQIPNVIIDNTIIFHWEAKPYCLLAQQHGYEVEFVESDAPWKADASACARACTHKVPEPVIRTMQKNFQPNISVVSVLASRAPWETE